MKTSTRIVELRTLAKELRVPSAWLLSEAESGRIPSIRTGETFLLDRPTVLRHLNRRLRRGDERKEASR
jgi:hypothetical protein